MKKINKFYSSNEYFPVTKMYETTINGVKYTSDAIILPSKYFKKNFIQDINKCTK